MVRCQASGGSRNVGCQAHTSRGASSPACSTSCPASVNSKGTALSPLACACHVPAASPQSGVPEGSSCASVVVVQANRPRPAPGMHESATTSSRPCCGSGTRASTPRSALASHVTGLRLVGVTQAAVVTTANMVFLRALDQR